MRVGHRAALPHGETRAAEGEGYDPGAHTVAEVLAYVAEHPDQADAVREAEEAGKQRITLLEALLPAPEGS